MKSKKVEKKKKMTKEIVERLIYILLGGGTRTDFERINNFDKQKLDRWFERLVNTFKK